MKEKRSRINEKDHVKITSFDSNPNIGLYAFVTDDYCLLGESIDEKYEKDIKDTLDVPVYRISIAGTPLIGVFCSGNSNCLLVPHIAFDYELKKLDELKIKYEIIQTKLTALGNNIAANNSGAVISPELEDDQVTKISNALSVPTKKGKVSELNNVGSCIVITNKGGLVHRDIKSFELKFLEDIFNIEILEGSVNMGSPYVKSGIIANSYGFLIGKLSGGPEINNADEALGFLDN